LYPKDPEGAAGLVGDPLAAENVM
jgi:hypothetical protein